MADYGICLIAVCAAIVFDVVSGLIKAFALDKVSTTCMRRGLFNKAALLLVVLLAIACDWSTYYIDLGFVLAGTLATGVTAIIVLMEIMSVLENVVEINPQLADSGIMRFFASTKSSDEKTED